MTFIGTGVYILIGVVWIIVSSSDKIQKRYGVEVANIYRFIILLLLLMIFKVMN